MENNNFKEKIFFDLKPEYFVLEKSDGVQIFEFIHVQTLRLVLG